MAVTEAENPLLGEITCGTLLQKLQEIWDEVGESDEERDKLLLQIEEECLNVYKKKVELAAKSRAELLQTLSDATVELSNLTTALGEKSYIDIPDKTSGTIKQQLSAIAPALEQLWQQKEERVRAFSDVQSQIQKICEEIAGGLNDGPYVVDESDLSLKRLDDFQSKLRELQKEKSDRLQKVLEFVSTVHDLCAVLGLDFLSTVTEVHPSLDEANGVQTKSISNETLARLAKTVLTLKEDKMQRLKKLQELATQLTDLWNLMDTPDEERELFDHVTCNISASVHEVTVSGALALDLESLFTSLSSHAFLLYPVTLKAKRISFFFVFEFIESIDVFVIFKLIGVTVSIRGYYCLVNCSLNLFQSMMLLKMCKSKFVDKDLQKFSNPAVFVLDAIRSMSPDSDWANEGGDPCIPVLWSWVNCSSTSPPRVTKIALSRKNLRAGINYMEALTELWLDGDGLTGILPDMSKLVNLKIMHLEKNQLSGSLPPYLAHLPNLQIQFMISNCFLKFL